jgi:hypothetical protein
VPQRLYWIEGCVLRESKVLGWRSERREEDLDHQTIARGLLALLCLIQAIATLGIDLSRTHATNPLWPRHARFHLVWQVFTTSLLCALDIALVWWSGPHLEQRFYLAAILTFIPLLGFVVALAGRRMYGGALSDPNGIPPARVKVFARTLHVDLNVVAVAVALMALGVIVRVFAG